MTLTILSPVMRIGYYTIAQTKIFILIFSVTIAMITTGDTLAWI